VDIKTVEYAGTVAVPSQAPPGELPEIAFSGRSNVGKSSLINVLLRRTRNKIAHVSATPGKTQALNFYRVNDRFFLIDLPGFGYARVPGATKAEWKGLIEGYLARSDRLRGVVHLVDVRHAPSALDRSMLAYLAASGPRRSWSRPRWTS
jgi:GTP-binding protein